jgi:transposase
LRELVRYRAKLVAIRSGLKAQVHAVLAKAGVLVAVSDLFGVGGRQRLAKVPLGAAYAERVGSLLELIDVLDGHEARFAGLIATRLGNHRGYQALQQVPGIGPVGDSAHWRAGPFEWGGPATTAGPISQQWECRRSA